MAPRDKLPIAMNSIIHALADGHVYGYRVMEATKLPSGTVYPALATLEREGLITSRWERPPGEFAYRPARKCYELTDHGRAAVRQHAERHNHRFLNVEVG